MKSSGNIVTRRSKAPFILILLLIILAGVVFSIFLGVKRIKLYLANNPNIASLERLWQQYDYDGVHKISHELLQTNPYNINALIYHGYSSFYLSVSQIDTQSSRAFLDESINSLRIALHNTKKKTKSQIEYMLGKAYFYKNTVSSYYYADLSLKYLALAVKDGFKAPDISEYMGLCYAQLGEHLNAIQSFTEALLTRESPSLLLSIADEYYNSGQANVAKQYLYRIKKEASDDELVQKSSMLLGTIYTDERDYTNAKKEFNAIIEKNPNCADAYYNLGLISEKEGDIVQARSLWRKTLKVKPSHTQALEKLSNSK